MSTETVIGGVLLALGALLAIGNGARSFLRGSNGSAYDVTRREFDELKKLTHETLKELNEHMLQMAISLVEIRAALKVPTKQ